MVSADAWPAWFLSSYFVLFGRLFFSLGHWYSLCFYRFLRLIFEPDPHARGGATGHSVYHPRHNFEG